MQNSLDLESLKNLENLTTPTFAESKILESTSGIDIMLLSAYSSWQNLSKVSKKLQSHLKNT